MLNVSFVKGSTQCFKYSTVKASKIIDFWNEDSAKSQKIRELGIIFPSFIYKNSFFRKRATCPDNYTKPEFNKFLSHQLQTFKHFTVIKISWLCKLSNSIKNIYFKCCTRNPNKNTPCVNTLTFWFMHVLYWEYYS